MRDCLWLMFREQCAIGVVEVVQVPLGDDVERADRCEPETVLAIQFVQVIASVRDELSFGAARQFQRRYEQLARVVVPICRGRDRNRAHGRPGRAGPCSCATL
jgi:hypothetical protein